VEFLSQDLEQALQRVNQEIAAVFESDNLIIREVGAFIAESGGKRLRPALAILSAESCGRPVDDDVITLATSIELFHVATLLHDDVIDHADTRRGRPSVNAKWSDNIAILMADFLFGRAFDKSLKSLKPEIGRILCKVTSKMCEGELFQIEREGKILNREDYFRIIENKTAWLFSASVGLGGLIADASEEEIRSLAEFGMNFGMAFQITDDTLDYVAQDDKWGKPIGTDFVNGKQTLPLIHTLELASPEDRQELLGFLGNEGDLKKILPIIDQYKGLEHAREVAEEYARKANACLDVLKPNDSRAMMRKLCANITARQY